MKKFIRLSIIPLSFLSASAFANFGLSIDGMNANIERCFRQTQLIEQGFPAEKLSARSCTRVINNTWTSRKSESAARVNRGLVYLHKGRNDRALKDFVRAAKIYPQRYEAHIAAAQLLFAKQAFNEALAHYDKAIDIKGQDPSLLKNRRLTALSLENDGSQQVSMKLGKEPMEESLQ